MAALLPLLPLLIVAAFVSLEDFLSAPSCSVSRGGDAAAAPDDAAAAPDDAAAAPDDLKVMIIADLLLPGSGASYADLLFRSPYAARFLKKSFEKLDPDMLIVMGDVSVNRSEWFSSMQQLVRIMGPFLSIPYHVVLGDRDVGECDALDGVFVDEVASGLPGLDSYGCGSFRIGNVSFVSLNAVAMLCGENDLRFGVEKMVESESVGLRSSVEGVVGGDDFTSFRWRGNEVVAGSGPVVLVHFPLHWAERSGFGGDVFREGNIWNGPCMGLKGVDDRGVSNAGHYARIQTLPPNVTEYIFQSMKPRMVFSAHTHFFCDHTHGDGTREVTVPALSWATDGDPGFVLVTFKQKNVVIVSHCSLATESFVLTTYIVMFVLVIVTTLLMKWSYLIDFARC